MVVVVVLFTFITCLLNLTLVFCLFSVVVYVVQYYAKRLAGNIISEITCVVSGGTLNLNSIDHCCVQCLVVQSDQSFLHSLDCRMLICQVML